MADRPIIFPRLVGRTGNNRFETLGGDAGFLDNHGSAPWIAGGTIVTITSGLLNPVVTDGVLACGYCIEASAATAAASPPATRHDPHIHWPFNVRDCLFLVNITDASGNIGAANSAPQLSAIAIGERYAMLRPTSGTYAKYQFLDSSDTTNDFWEVVAKPALVDGIANVAATYNGLVIAKIIPSLIQLS